MKDRGLISGQKLTRVRGGGLEPSQVPEAYKIGYIKGNESIFQDKSTRGR